MHKPADNIQQRLTEYALSLNYDALPGDVIHAAKVRVIDTLGALMGGFSGEPGQISRKLAARMPNPTGATVIGTRIKTTPDMAAFVNATTARIAEMNDGYHESGRSHGHPSDALTPVLAAAEHAQASGRDLITGVVLAYEVFLRVSGVFHSVAFDNTNFSCLGAAVAAGKLFKLPPSQLAHCISMAVTPNNSLSQVRMDRISMFKAVAAGQAGRAGIFAALLARAGMEGPHLPFEGKAGWCDHVAGKRFSLDTLGGSTAAFKILKTHIKHRASCGSAISSILAAEKLAPFRNTGEIRRITVEVDAFAKKMVGSGEVPWNPHSRETADHSIPYLTAVTLMEGTVTPRSFDQAHLYNPELRALMQKIAVAENREFTQAAHRTPVEHLARVTVETASGQRLIGESGGDMDDLAAPKSDAQIEEKFRGLSEDLLGGPRSSAILDSLWNLENVRNVSEIPADFAVN